MRLPLRLAAIVLPLTGLAGTWIWTHVRAQQGAEWDVPATVSGPQASLRGRFLSFRYDWPIGQQRDGGAPAGLCLSGTPPVIASAAPLAPGDAGCRFPVRASASGGRYDGIAEGKLYVGQEEVTPVRSQLERGRFRAVVRVRISRDGSIIPLAVSFPEDSKAAQPGRR